MQVLPLCPTTANGELVRHVSGAWLTDRRQYSDFRASYRMLAYLCEVKSLLRAQEQSVEELNKEIKQMTSEKAELERAISEVEAARKEERESALAVERSLRDHATGAHAAYQTMVE